MKSALRLLVAALAVSGPLFAHAQGLTREQVREDMIRYEAAGFNPARANPRTWVDDAQAASVRVMAAHDAGARTHLADRGAAAARCD
ncbi:MULTISPECIES: DUF4148 domain-containing protein [unclassified Burkholderia]|uniref:DUF4148 domain-containing protein n=1 Tax=unclassified Burkholderia TaxID=2613784 RepID=UPI000F57316D|nr:MULTISPECIES: DUF4148 domain-containing protein [unclassified Burkholderia]RQR40836.1 DUF4148 domain-containing protein [Burkholderia sp. Bp9131]RQR69933.1 DUF4148 domain-containing protein [Burkholderia sp. Bp9015]RQS28714.1 DUF4148 domain-containing protein [Burkholderia sp. Bp8995]RQS46359.1 DUF4148 domain-containing protein [Burkholderia sp. Bp8990]RQS47079.1 DUF4148 domain-containing protein [Burkholderia sp. Bp8989]